MKRGNWIQQPLSEKLEKQAKKRERLLEKVKKHPPEGHRMPIAGSNTPKKTLSHKTAGKKPNQAKLKKKFDAIFSQFIRRKYANEEGMVKCYTCTTIKHWKEIQNGHWIPRNNLATRFSEDNCRPQCVGCNMFQKGMPDVFAVNLIKEGIDIVALQQTRYSVFKIDSLWYLEKIAFYEEKLSTFVVS